MMKIYFRYMGVRDIVFLGDVVSPTIVEDLYSCGYNVYGLNGLYDDVSVIDVFKKINGYLSSYSVKVFNGYRFHVIGLNPMHRTGEAGDIDIVLTYYPGWIHRCGTSHGLSVVDDVVREDDPLLIIHGRCREQCLYNNIVCPGQGFRGDVLFLDLGDKYVDIFFGNIYSFINYLNI